MLTAIFGSLHAAVFARQIVEQVRPDVTIVVGQAWQDAVCFAKPTHRLDELLENSVNQPVVLVWNMVCVLDERWQEFLHRYKNLHQIVIAATSGLRGALVWQAELVVAFGLANQPDQPDQPDRPDRPDRPDQTDSHLACLYHHRFKFNTVWTAFCNQLSNLPQNQVMMSPKPADQLDQF